MKIAMGEIMHGNWRKKGWWRHGKEDGTCLRKEGTRMPSFRTSVRWFVATHYITQMVTSLGAFKERLYRLALAEDSRCFCPLGGPETSEYILY
jgi:hypothetical protein